MQQLFHSLAPAASVERAVRMTEIPVQYQRFGYDVLHAIAGIEGAKWILKDDLHMAAKHAQFRAVRFEQINTIEEHCARSRLDEAKDESPESTLARARFTDQAQGLAGSNIEGHVIHGANFAGAATSE
jgi:hypothetical protein